MDSQKRRLHLIDYHKYPRTFSFSLSSNPQKGKNKAKQENQEQYLFFFFPSYDNNFFQKIK